MSGWFGSPDRTTALRLRRSGVYVTSRVRRAVRYAVLTESTITDAAYAFGLNPGAVWNAWERMFPDVPHPKRIGL